MIHALVYLVVIILIIGLVYYVIDAIPVPEPLNRFAKIAIMVVGCLFVILFLLQFAGISTGWPGRL